MDYGDRRELVLLANVITATGEELSYDSLVSQYSNIFAVVRVFDFKNIKNAKDLQALEEVENEEGYVFRFEDGFRFKWKFSDFFSTISALPISFNHFPGRKISS